MIAASSPDPPLPAPAAVVAAVAAPAAPLAVDVSSVATAIAAAGAGAPAVVCAASAVVVPAPATGPARAGAPMPSLASVAAVLALAAAIASAPRCAAPDVGPWGCLTAAPAADVAAPAADVPAPAADVPAPPAADVAAPPADSAEDILLVGAEILVLLYIAPDETPSSVDVTVTSSMRSLSVSPASLKIVRSGRLLQFGSTAWKHPICSSLLGILNQFRICRKAYLWWSWVRCLMPSLGHPLIRWCPYTSGIGWVLQLQVTPAGMHGRGSMYLRRSTKE